MNIIITVITLVGVGLLVALFVFYLFRLKAGMTVAGILLVLASIASIKALQIGTMIAAGAHATMPAEAVSTAVAKEEDWPPTLTAVGSLSAVQGVTVSAELDGKVTEIAFEAGTKVKAGDLLVRQDAAAEMAQLRSAEAGVVLARLNRDRSRELLAKATISQSQLDADNAAYEQAVAAADNLRAAIEKKTMRAPFAGRLGVRLINLGQFLKAGDPIVSLQALNPIFADFYVPQQEISNLAAGLAVELTSDTLPGKTVKGVVTAINPDIDVATRNVRVQATAQNPSELLRPGMFVQVSVQLPATNKVVTIPATSILYAPYGDTVFIVEDKPNAAGEPESPKVKVVRQQVVRLGASRGDFVAVTSGLKPGETVVSVGAFRLRPGMAVNPQNALAPDAKLAPKPKDT
jgi:membrane fusion protein, multidrug efflux system